MASEIFMIVIKSHLNHFNDYHIKSKLFARMGWFYREAPIGEVQEKSALKTLKKFLKNISKVVYIRAESLKRIYLLKKIPFTCLLKFLDHLFLIAVCSYPRPFRAATETL